ncbi:MAG: IS66 family insertion sequence element accessory protein TnpB [Pseudobacteriovorax sp.]|nr:IS66 family insertion sequence element accessory protein TnpB [Pseudobacteriovorax sp.]
MKQASDFSKILLWREPVDMRKQINGLAEIVESELQENLFENTLFLFCNKKRDLVKAIYFDKAGFCLWIKKLDSDRFPWFRKADQAELTISARDFELVVDGVDVFKRHRKLNFTSYS